MGSAIFGIAVSGLNAAQTALETASNNISNVNTPDYHRQVITQTNNAPFFAGFGYVGRGVDVTQVNRVYSQFLDAQVSSTTSSSSFYQTQNNLLTQIDDMVGDSSTGVSPAVQNFFNGLQTLSQSPNSIPARQTVINLGQTLASQIQSMSSQLSQINDAVNGQITDTVGSINSYASQLANLNAQILAMNGSGSTPPNDLMDQRDELVQQLSKLVNVNVLQQSDGSYSVFIGNGQSLVLAGHANQLQTVQNPNDPQELSIGYSNGGSSTIIPENLLSGGQLGGLLTFRTGALNRSFSDLGRLAISLSDAVNRQNSVGLDANNNQAPSQFFANLNSFLPATTDTAQQQVALFRSAAAQFAMVINDPSQIGVASALKASPPIGANPAISTTANSGNTGTASFIGSQLQYGSLATPITLSYSSGGLTASGGYTVTASGSNGSYILSNPGSPNITLQMTGTPAAGDKFTIANQNAGISSLATQLVAGQLSSPVTLTYSGGTFTASGGFAVTNPSSGSYVLKNAQGVTVNLTLSGAPASGDQFVLANQNASLASISSVAQIAGLSPPTPPATPPTPPSLGVPTPDVPITLTYDSTTQTFTAAGLSGAATVTPSTTTAGGFSITDANGAVVQFQLNGTPANGDRFILNNKVTGPTSADAAPSDNANLQAINALLTQNTMVNTPSGGSTYMPSVGSTPNTTFAGFFGQFVSYVGSVTNVASTQEASQTAALNQAQKVQQSFSGVSLDEEAASLIKYQQAYQASSKVIQMAQQIFNSLLQLGS